jgi:DNA-binding FadR family transcriptional regulator
VNNKIPLAQSVAENIVDIIKRKNMKAGDKLPSESELTELLNVSRSTLREALKILTSRNILVTRQGSGIFVSKNTGIVNDPFGLEFLGSEKLILDMFDTRLILEPEIAAIAAINASKEDIEKIKKQCDEVEKAINENVTYADKDALFHKLISETSGNTIINHIIPIVHNSIQKSIDYTNNSLIQNTVYYHRKITEAIQNRDSLGAKYAMICHIGANRQYIIDRIRCKNNGVK